MRRPSTKSGACVLALVGAIWAAPAAAVPLGEDEQAFVEQMVRKHGFDRADLTRLLEDAAFQQGIVDAISRPAESKPWHLYRPIMLTRERIEGGVEFWSANAAALARAEAQYGVPPEVVTAIIGVETKYGRNTGRHRVLDALVTLAFGYPKRAPFFRSELENFLLMAREEGLDARELKGSYAGAMGRAQFMPSSFRNFAVDFDGDGRRDLWTNDTDAIGSVASYLARHGWRRGEPVAFPADGAGPEQRRFVEAGVKPAYTLGDLTAAGIRAPAGLARGTPASLIELETEDGSEFWLGMFNFYVITRYNRSTLYAMAVHQLSQEIVDLRRGGASRGAP
jgi:membrane-bound lytic murein transglycosylase B